MQNTGMLDAPYGGNAMSDEATTKPLLRHRAAEEIKEMLALTAYLYVCLGALMLLKSAILRDAGIPLRFVGHRHRQGPGARQVHVAGTYRPILANATRISHLSGRPCICR